MEGDWKMFTVKEIEKIKELSELNSDFAQFVKRFKEEQQFNLSKIFHEIRNPVTLINGAIQLIELQYPEIQKIDYWTCLVEDVNSLKDLLNDLSNFNNGEYINKVDINLCEFLNDLKLSFSPIATARSIVLEFPTDDNFTIVQGDKIKLKQCFTNIIKNALEAVPDGTGIVKISTNYCNNNINILFYNNGISIPEHDLEKIFLPFVTYKSNGTGLGLAVTKRIIESHTGTISVTSDSCGTIFTLSLPIIITENQIS